MLNQGVGDAVLGKWFLMFLKAPQSFKILGDIASHLRRLEFSATLL
jgi:hypothetical protein